MTGLEKTCNFLKEAETYYLATVDDDKARVRPFGTINIYEGKLYFQSGLVKDVTKQMLKNPNVELCAMKGNEWIRVCGEAVLDEREEAQESMLEAYPNLKEMYSVGDGNIAVLYLKNGKATIYSFAGGQEEITF